MLFLPNNLRALLLLGKAIYFLLGAFRGFDDSVEFLLDDRQATDAARFFQA